LIIAECGGPTSGGVEIREMLDVLLIGCDILVADQAQPLAEAGAVIAVTAHAQFFFPFRVSRNVRQGMADEAVFPSPAVWVAFARKD